MDFTIISLICTIPYFIAIFLSFFIASKAIDVETELHKIVLFSFIIEIIIVTISLVLIDKISNLNPILMIVGLIVAIAISYMLVFQTEWYKGFVAVFIASILLLIGYAVTVWLVLPMPGIGVYANMCLSLIIG